MRQKGFTLLELLLALGVGSVLLAGAVLAIYQVMVGTERSNSKVVVLTDIDRAVLAIKKDLMMTQNTDLSTTPQGSANLTWIDYTSFSSENGTTSHYSSYVLSGTELRRTYDGTISIVGRSITSINFTQNDKVVTVVITATSPGTQQRSATLKFSGYIRAEEAE